MLKPCANYVTIHLVSLCASLDAQNIDRSSVCRACVNLLDVACFCKEGI